MMQKKLLYIGHRGTNIDADENTINAFKKADESGAEYIEFDIRQTKDKKLVVMHNASLNETTNASGYIRDFNYSELKKIKTKNHEQSIPTLEEALKEKYNQKLKFIIDIKERNISDKVLEIAKKLNVFDDTYICSSNIKDLILANKKFLDCKICYVIYRKKRLNDIINYIISDKMPIKINMLSLSYNLVNEEITKICNKNKILSLAWGFRYIKSDPLIEIKDLIEKGIDGIIFDNYKNIIKIKHWLKSKYSHIH